MQYRQTMKMNIIRVAILACACVPALAVEPRLEFEVASVKPAPPPSGGMIRTGLTGGPGSADPGRINYEFVNLRQVLAQAYGVKSYQISGPSTLDTERYNITAKVPAGTTKDQFGVMLQNLVADRFKMTVHREKKELSSYALVVAKGGVKMKVAAEDPAGSDAPPPSFGGSAGSPARLNMGKDGFPEMPKGIGRGGVAMMMMPGKMRMSGSGQTIARLCETLERQLDRAVVDMTELTAKYDFTLTFEPEQSKMMAGLGRGPVGGPGAGSAGSGGGGVTIGGPGGGGPDMHNADAETPPNLFTAVQEQLGLKLEPRKILTELVVIDHLEKAPIEN